MSFPRTSGPRLLGANALVLSLGVTAAVALSGQSAPAAAPSLVDAAAVQASPLPLPVVTPAVTPTATPTHRAAPRATATPRPRATTTPRPARRVEPGLVRGNLLGIGERDLSAYRGLGTWVDAYDFAPEFGGTLLDPEAVVDRMADAGIKTIYLQAAKEDRRSPGGIVRPDLVVRWLARAHERGMAVQAWYLPKLVDPVRDEQHLAALLAFRANGRGFDSIGLDIEARNVHSVAVRNARLITLARKLRAAAPSMPLSAIVLAPVHTDIVSPSFWPAFPWAQLKDSFDVWQTMGYWTDRKKSSPYSDAYTQTLTNVQLLRQHLGDVPVHPIGGVGVATLQQLQGYIRAVRESGSLGGSLYDWVTTPYNAYGYLRQLPS